MSCSQWGSWPLHSQQPGEGLPSLLRRSIRSTDSERVDDDRPGWVSVSGCHSNAPAVVPAIADPSVGIVPLALVS